MSDSNVLIDRLTAAFGFPDRPLKEIPGFLAEMRKLTRGCRDEGLDLAADNLIRTGGKGWPAPKAIVAAIADAGEMLAIGQGKSSTLPAGHKWPWERDAERAAEWAKEFCAQSRWQPARDEGWERSLRLWAVSYAHGRYRCGAEPERTARPSDEDVADWRQYRREAKSQSPASVAADTMSDSDFVDGVADGTIQLNGIMAGALRRMAQAMKAKRGEGSEW